MAQAATSSGAKKEVGELEKHIRRQGKGEFKVVPAGSGHKKIVRKNGTPVTDDNGPLILSSSPSDGRWREMSVKRLMKVGVLKFDPWNPPNEPNGRGRHLADPAIRQRAQLKLDEANRKRAERTRRARARLEPFVARLGGWDRRGVTADVAHVVWHYAKSRGRVEAWRSWESAYNVLTNLRKGGTLSDESCLCVEILLDDLEQAPDSRARYFDLLRESKGVIEEPQAVTLSSRMEVLPARRVAEVADGDGVAHLGPAFTPPTIALEAVMMMTAGVQNLADPDLNRIMVTGQRILQLEMMELRLRGDL